MAAHRSQVPAIGGLMIVMPFADFAASMPSAFPRKASWLVDHFPFIYAEAYMLRSVAIKRLGILFGEPVKVTKYMRSYRTLTGLPVSVQQDVNHSKIWVGLPVGQPIPPFGEVRDPGPHSNLPITLRTQPTLLLRARTIDELERIMDWLRETYELKLD